MEMISIEKELRENSYPGRGIIIGKSAHGEKCEQPQPHFRGRGRGNQNAGV